MSVNTYTPDSTKIIHNTSVDFVTRYINTPVHLVQYDNSAPIIAVKLYSNGTPYVIPSGMDVNVRIKKPDGTFIYNHVLGCDVTETMVYVEVTQQTCAVKGALYPVIEVTDGVNVAASGYIYAEVDENPVTDADIESSSEAKAIQEYVDSAKSWAVGHTGTREGEDTDNSKYYAEQSALHEAQALVYANDAIASANSAKTSEDNAKNSADDAKDSADDAQAYATNAKASEDNAKDSEDAASQAALDAIAEANKATTQANKADARATEAESWAVGGTNTRAGEDTNNAKYWASQAQAIVGIGIATTTKAGIVKPDGSTITVDSDGTIHAVGGGAIGTLTDAEIDSLFNGAWA